MPQARGGNHRAGLMLCQGRRKGTCMHRAERNARPRDVMAGHRLLMPCPPSYFCSLSSSLVFALRSFSPAYPCLTSPARSLEVRISYRTR